MAVGGVVIGRGVLNFRLLVDHNLFAAPSIA